jgi:AmmeMemoRadiSam system protein B
MKIRRRCLPYGWYPSSPDAVRESVRGFLVECPPAEPRASAVVAPHAGWEFSGAVAAAAAASLRRAAGCIVVVGGHLGPRDAVRAAFEDAFETPLGPLSADVELLEAVRQRIAVEEDRAGDNTVEVQLPLLAALFPHARVVAFRAPPSGRARELGEAIRDAAAGLGREAVVLGSTDLTHYGPSYDFAPRGQGEAAVRWVREVNDRRFLDALLALDGDEAVGRALRERSACSPGAAAAAVAFARAGGATGARLLHYRTSLDVMEAPSFVGYAAVAFGA